MPPDIRALADTSLHNPVTVQVSPVASTVELISQSVYFVPRKGKPALLKHLIKDWQMGRTLVFTRTKHGADKVVKELLRGGIKAEAIHGNKSQNHRTRTLNAFKSTSPPVPVATDIASRGIDVDEITHVINFDLPDVPETYVHRIGRTARAGASGIAVSFCDPMEERGDLKAIERLIRRPIEVRRDLPELAGVNEGTALRTEELATERQGNRSYGWSKNHGSHNGESRIGRGGFGGNQKRSGRPHAKFSKRNTSSQDARGTHSSHQPKRQGGHGGQAVNASSGPKRGFQARGRGKGRGADASGGSK
jgi:ATP-dependent RNA helicase RhlE